MGVIGTVKAVVQQAREQEITFLAAGLAYYAFVSFLPMLLLALVIASLVGGEQLAMQITSMAQDLLTPTAQDLINDALTNASGRGGASIVGTLVLLWSTLKVFRGLDEAFSRVYDVKKEESFVGTILDGLTVVTVIAIGIAAMVVAGIVLSLFPTIPFIGTLSSVLLLLALAIVFLPLYYVFPDVDISVREAIPGALLAAFGWLVLQVGFRFYASRAAQFEAYGILGAVLLLVTWLYIGGIILLLGAVVNAVLAGRFRDRHEDTRSHSFQHQTDDKPIMTDKDSPAPDIVELKEELRRLETELDDFERDVDEHTVEKDDLKAELQQYVRSRIRDGHARGWGPYLVLLYGTLMTLGAFYWLTSGWAILAMVVIWLSTLGLYAVMLLIGFGIDIFSSIGWVRDRITMWRS